MEKFDAYHKWLGIPPEEQPPNHYRLLGVSQYEADPEVISSAANQRTVYLRQRAAGPQQELTKKLLDEVAAARNCLLDAKKKSAYDIRLKSGSSGEPPTGVIVSKSSSASNPELDAIAAEPPPSAAETIRKLSRSKFGLAAVGLAVVVIAGGIYLMSTGSGSKSDLQSSQQNQNEVTSTGSSDSGTAMPDATDANTAQTSTETTKTETEPTKPPTKEVADGATSTANTEPAPRKTTPTREVDPHEIQALHGHKFPVVELAATTDGRFLVSASQGRDRDSGQPAGECLVWDMTTGQIAARYEGHPGLVRSVAISPDGRYVLSSGEDIRLWELETGKDVRELKTSRRPANRVAFAPDGRAATVGAATLIVWNIDTGEATQQIAGLSVFSQAVGFSLDGKVVAAGTGEKGEVIGLWDRETGTELLKLTGHQAAVRCLAFLPDGKHLWSCDAANLAFLWNLAEGKFEKRIGPASCFRTTPDGELVLIGTSAGALRLHDALSSRFRVGFPQLSCQIRDVALLVESQRVVFAGSGLEAGEPTEADFAIHVWTLPPNIRFAPASGTPAPLELAAKPSTESTSPAPATDRVKKRLAPPTVDELKQAQQQVRDIFKTDFSQAKKSEQKGTLATKLLNQAEATRDDPAGRYALLIEARELAEASLNVEVTLQLADRIGEAYEVDVLPLKLESLKQLSTNLKSTLAMQAATEFALDLADDAVAEDNFDAAAELTRIATSLAVKSKLTKLRDDTKARTDVITHKRKLHDEAEQARKTLEDSPDDAAAHEKLGRFLCFVRDDWSAGLPHLTKSVTPALRSAAELEQATTSDKEKLAELADAWYDFAKTARLTDKPFAQARALKWYREVSANTTGLARVRAQTRIAELSRLVPERPASGSGRKPRGS